MKETQRDMILSIGLTAVLLNSSPIFAAENARQVNFDIALGAEMMAGDTTYSIGGPIVYYDGSIDQKYFPLSELEWPLDIWLTRLSVGMDIGQSLRLNGVVKTNIGEPSDNMADKDWLTESNHGQLDVYSESNISDFSAFIIDVDLEWTFLQRQSWILYGGFGLQSQKFEYDGQLINQYSPSGQSGWTLNGDGSVGITYEITYTMPYIIIGTGFQVTPDLIIEGSFAYSPKVSADDEDHHLLRNRITMGDMDGDAYMLNMTGSYNFISSWFVEGGFNYTKISVDGDMEIYLYGYQLATEREESESTQISGYLSVGYNF